MTYHDHDLQIGSRTIHYREWGSAENPPVMLLHGATSWLGTWDAIAADLSRDYRCLVPDLRGHGDSDPAPRYTFPEMSADLVAFAAALDIPQFRLVTHSLASAIGWLTAIHHPALVDRFVLADFAPDTAKTRAGDRMIAMLQQHAKDVFMTPEDAVAASRAPDETTRNGVYQRIKQREDGGWVWKHDAAGLVRMFTGEFGVYTEEERWADIARIPCKVLLIRGGASTTMRPDTAERMQQTIPNATLITIEGAGHMVPFEQPDAFLAVIRPFLA